MHDARVARVLTNPRGAGGAGGAREPGEERDGRARARAAHPRWRSSLLLSSLEMSDTQVYEP